MRTGVFDLLRRGFDNTLANWQLSLIRFLEAFLFIVIIALAILFIVVPIAVSVGFNAMDMDTPEDMEDALAVLLQKWVLLLWIFVGVSMLLLVLTAVHSFVEAGVARVFVDADRAAGDELNGPRTRYANFTIQRWLEGARDGWWPVFWIYNVLWGIGLLVILLPFAAVLVAAIVLGGTTGEGGVAVALTCLGMLVTMLFAVAVTVVLAIWTTRAIVDSAVYRTTARAAIAYAARSIRADLGRHVGVAVCMFVVAMAASMFFSSLGFFTGIGDSIGRPEVFMLLTAPVRILTSLFNSAVSAVIGSWFVASYASLANHR